MRRKALGSTLIGLVAVILTVVLSGDFPTVAAPAARDDLVTVAVEPDTLNPLFDGVGYHHALFTVDVQRDDSGRAFAQGVEYLPSVRDGTWSVDGQRMRVRWRLRHRTWHDGRPVTCGDYVFTFNVMRNSQVALGRNAAVDTAALRLIENVRCPQGAAAREIVVTWKARSPIGGLTIIAGFPLPRHVVEPFYRRSPGQLHLAPYGQDPSVTITDGPYRFAEWRRGHSITIHAVQGHSLFGTPRIRRIVHRFVTAREALAMMLAGEMDLNPAVRQSLRDVVVALRPPHLRLVPYPTASVEHIDFNLDNPFLQDVRVRRAIAHGLNRVAIAHEAWGAGTNNKVVHTYLPHTHPAYTTDVQIYPYDPARSRALLRDAGFSPGSDGVMRNAAGQRLSLELNTGLSGSVQDEPRQVTQALAQRQLREVGIEIIPVTFPSRVFFSEILPKRRFTGLAMYAWILGPTDGCEGLYTLRDIPSEENGWNGQNYPGYRNPEMDTLCRTAAEELDPERRQALLRRTQVIYARDLPTLSLSTWGAVALVNVGLENFRPTAQLSRLSWNVHTWYWK